MAKKPPTLTFDAGRLSVLAKARDRQKAQLRALSGRYDDARERLADVRRRAALTRENALHDNGPNRAVAEENAAKLQKQAEEIRTDMQALRLEIDAQAAAASEAGRVLSAALTFARDEGLSIPRELQAEAEPRNVMGVA